jgi:hypothetical protein
MSKHRKPLLGILKPMWAAGLPGWQPGLCSPVFYTKPEATFTRTRFAPDSPCRLPAYIEVSDEWAGAFTCDIFISDSGSQLESQNTLRFSHAITSRKPGAYRIG